MLFVSAEGDYTLSQLTFAKKINKWLHSPLFLLLVTLFAVMANVFGGEMLFYGFCAVTVIYAALFGEDIRLVIPFAAFCYLLPGTANNPGEHADSIFSMSRGGLWLILWGALILFSVLFRFALDRTLFIRRFRTQRPALLYGMLALGAAYVLSGVGSKGYLQIAGKNILFALLQLAAVAVLYLVLFYGVKWETVDRSYMALVGVLMGVLVSLELLNVYRVNEVVVEGVVNKANIYLGWGISTNIGLLPVMAIPFAFYFICKGKMVLLNNLLAILFCLAAVLTCSRAAILAAGAIYLLCCIVTVLCSRKLLSRISTGLCALAALVVLVCVLKGSETLLQTIFANGLQSDSRLELYGIGLSFFKKHPVFGGAFYILNSVENSQMFGWIWADLDSFVNVFPGRWHNTVVQLLASCGIVGLAAYLFHRVQTVRLFLQNRTVENVYIAISILALLGMSLLDCHFFNIGPAMIYSCMLAFAENKTKE